MIYRTSKNVVYKPSSTEYMVLWVRPGAKAIIIDSMYNKAKELCWDWVKKNKNNSDYTGGTLIAVPVKRKQKLKL